MNKEQRAKLVDEALAISTLDCKAPSEEDMKVFEKYIDGEMEIDESVQDDKSLYGVGDVCTINRPYEGYNTDRIAWSTSGTGPATLANTVSRETSSEIFGEFSGKTEVVEAKVGFKIGKKTTCTSSYSVNLASGEYKRIVGYFRYKGYFVDYYTWGGLNHVGTYEVGRPIGIDFIVYSR